MIVSLRYGYAGSQYTHQGWLNAEQSHLVMDDELDEQKEASLDGHTRTMVWDVSRLDMPTLIGNFYSSEQSIGRITCRNMNLPDLHLL